MTRWHLLGGVWLAAMIIVGPALGEEKPAQDTDTIDKLIKQLGSEDFGERKEAQEKLAKIGPKALEKLQVAAQSSDVETRRRAKALVGRIESDLTFAALMTPKKVKLNLKDETVSDALRQLEKATGYRIEWGTNSAETAKRKITLTTEEIPFSEALELLCEKAQLVQSRIAPKEAPANRRFGKDKNVKEEVSGPFKPQPPVQETISLLDGSPASGPVAYSGSMGIRATLTKDGKSPDLLTLTLDASAEPRLRDFRVVSVQQIDKAVDDQGQTLTVASTAKPAGSKTRGSITINGRTISPRAPAVEDRTILASLKKGEKVAGGLREVSGSLLVSALHEVGPLASLNDPVKAMGKSAVGRDGYSMKLDAIEETKEGMSVTVSVTHPIVEDPSAAALGRAFGGGLAIRGNIVINGMRVGDTAVNAPPPYPRLFDEKGQAWELAEVTKQTLSPPGKEKRDCTFVLLYRPPARESKAAKLSLFATEPATVSVPFTLKNVTLK